jgi:hypothetical protein
MKGLKFSNGYTVGLRQSVNMMTGKLIGLKSHDYHIIMERLLTVLFWGYFDDAVWMVLAELSYFYRQLSWRRYQCFYARWRNFFL